MAGIGEGASGVRTDLCPCGCGNDCDCPADCETCSCNEPDGAAIGMQVPWQAPPTPYTTPTTQIW